VAVVFARSGSGGFLNLFGRGIVSFKPTSINRSRPPDRLVDRSDNELLLDCEIFLFHKSVKDLDKFKFSTDKKRKIENRGAASGGHGTAYIGLLGYAKFSSRRRCSLERLDYFSTL
jgi:hypothetical protein